MKRLVRMPGGLRFGLLVVVLALLGLASGRLLQGCVETKEPGTEEAAARPVKMAAGSPASRLATPPADAADIIADGGAILGSRPWGNNPGLGPPAPVTYPRDPAEWQAMLVDLTSRQICSDSSVCGLALACKDDGLCGPCVSDGDCVAGETCVLDHCLLRDNAGCHSRRDCGPDELCVLTNYSQGRRSNTDMRSYCLSRSGGEEQTPENADPPPERDPAPPAPPTPVQIDDLMRSLQEPGR